MRRHLHIVLPLSAALASVFIALWPWIQSRFGGYPRDIVSDAVIEPAAASSSFHGAPPVLLTIKRLGIEAPIAEAATDTEDGYQKALENGIVHFPGTAFPGQYGNAYFFGHSSDYLWNPGSYKTVFEKLPSVQMGDEIVVTDASGTSYTYAVIGTKIVTPQDFSVLSQGDGTRRLLSLQTSYPIGMATKRFIVIAELSD